MSWTKADGAKIKITFDHPLVGDVAGQQSNFTVTCQEYTYVPGGTLQTITKTVNATYAGDTACELVLEMAPLTRFESAVGDITVAYSGGSLVGEGGAVAAFTQNFSPSDLAYKGDQNDAEHIEMSVTASGTLTKINYINTAPQDMGHIELSVTAAGTLTNINDL